MIEPHNRILGVDPGLSGALALLSSDGAALSILDVPTTTRKVGKSLKRQIDPYALASWLELHRGRIAFAMVEQVGAMPGQGVTSSFNFGFTAGAIRGCLAGAGITVRTVPPVVWKRKFGLLGQGKDASRGEASRRLPSHAAAWSRAKDDGRAEAALLAIYGIMLAKGEIL